MGFERLEILKKKLQNIPLEEILMRISQRNRAQIEDKNIAQLQAGLDAEGKEITPAYSPFTVAIKKAKGQRSDLVTLEDTGAFYKGIMANPMQGGIEMTDSDSKYPKLAEKYGDVIGLTEKSISELREEVYLPELKEEVKDYFARG